MTKVAAHYGISGVALKKICDKHRIPVPGRVTGRRKPPAREFRAHFRAVTDLAINRIVIYGSPAQGLPEVVKEAREAAKKREQQPENQVEVGAVPNDLHPKVAMTGKRSSTSRSVLEARDG